MIKLLLITVLLICVNLQVIACDLKNKKLKIPNLASKYPSYVVVQRSGNIMVVIDGGKVTWRKEVVGK